MTKRTSAANAAPLSLDTPDRRTMLATAGAAAVLAAIGTPAAAAVDPDAALLAMRAQLASARAMIADVTEARTPDQEAREAKLLQACNAEDVVIDRLADTPARTLAGLGFKVEASRGYDHMSPELIASIMADVAAFAAAHPVVSI